MTVGYRVVLCTAPPDEARAIARALVERRLAACVNVLPGVASIYQWEGTVCEDDELLLIIKTSEERLPALTDQLLELHPYDVPEIIALPINALEGNPMYLQWIQSEVMS